MSGLEAIRASVGWLWTVMLSAQMSMVLQATLATIFLVSGVHKVRHPVATATSVSRFGLPVAPTRRVGLIIATGELVVAFGLIAPVGQIALTALCASLTLSLVFVVLTARSVVHGESFTCNCLGPGELVSLSSVVRAIALSGASAVAVAGLAWGEERVIDVESLAISVGMAITIVCLAYLVSQTSRFRTFRAELHKNVDWMWIAQKAQPRNEG